MADGKGFVIGSIEGRCGVNNYDTKRTDKNSGADYCFKCHRQEKAETKTADVWSVNGFAFNSKYNTLLSYGSDGSYCNWNIHTKSKYSAKKEPFPAPITAGDFSEAGNIIAFATGYDWSKGANGLDPSKHAA